MRTYPNFEIMVRRVCVDRVCKVLPVVVRNCAWQTPSRETRRKKQIERLRGRPHTQFAEMNHFRDAQTVWRVEPEIVGETDFGVRRGNVRRV